MAHRLRMAHQCVLTAITLTIRMLALLTAITVRIGFPAACSLAPARGITAAITGATTRADTAMAMPRADMSDAATTADMSVAMQAEDTPGAVIAVEASTEAARSAGVVADSTAGAAGVAGIVRPPY